MPSQRPFASAKQTTRSRKSRRRTTVPPAAARRLQVHRPAGGTRYRYYLPLRPVVRTGRLLSGNGRRFHRRPAGLSAESRDGVREFRQRFATLRARVSRHPCRQRAPRSKRRCWRGRLSIVKEDGRRGSRRHHTLDEANRPNGTAVRSGRGLDGMRAVTAIFLRRKCHVRASIAAIVGVCSKTTSTFVLFPPLPVEPSRLPYLCDERAAR